MLCWGDVWWVRVLGEQDEDLRSESQNPCKAWLRLEVPATPGTGVQETEDKGSICPSPPAYLVNSRQTKWKWSMMGHGRASHTVSSGFCKHIAMHMHANMPSIGTFKSHVQFFFITRHHRHMLEHLSSLRKGILYPVLMSVSEVECKSHFLADRQKEEPSFADTTGI